MFAEETLRLPVIGSDNKLLRVLEVACRKIIGPAPRRPDLIHAVREYVVLRLAKGAATIEDVARHFNMSSRTPERRLEERGMSYRALVESIRCDLAKRYLANSQLRLHRLRISWVFRAGSVGPSVQAMDRQHADAIPRRAAMISRNVQPSNPMIRSAPNRQVSSLGDTHSVDLRLTAKLIASEQLRCHNTLAFT